MSKEEILKTYFSFCSISYVFLFIVLTSRHRIATAMCGCALTLARFPYFATFASGGGGGGGVGTTPPWRSAPDVRRASQKKKTVDASR